MPGMCRYAHAAATTSPFTPIPQRMQIPSARANPMAENFLAEVYHLSRLPLVLGAYNVPRVVREYAWSRLLVVSDATGRQKCPKNLVLLGTYGSGKSFLLRQL